MKPIPPKPKTPLPGPATLVPNEEEFAVWCEHPVTRWVALAYREKADACRKEWMIESWGAAHRDPQQMENTRMNLFIRADNFRAFLEASYADYLRTNHPEAWDEWRKTNGK